MRAYIDKKETLWKEYQEFMQEEKEYQIAEQKYTYSTKEVSLDQHFFSFLTDGNYDTLILGPDNQILLAQEGKEIKRKGLAITFFLTIPSESPDLRQMIQDRLKDFKYLGDEQYFITIIPRLFNDLNGEAIVRVMVFEKNNDFSSK